jgi:hypothetical protein
MGIVMDFCVLFVVDCFNKKSVVAIISLKRKIDLATKVKKNGGKVKLSSPKLKIEKNQLSKKIYMLTSTTPLQIRM